MARSNRPRLAMPYLSLILVFVCHAEGGDRVLQAASYTIGVSGERAASTPRSRHDQRLRPGNEADAAFERGIAQGDRVAGDDVELLDSRDLLVHPG